MGLPIIIITINITSQHQFKINVRYLSQHLKFINKIKFDSMNYDYEYRNIRIPVENIANHVNHFIATIAYDLHIK